MRPLLRYSLAALLLNVLAQPLAAQGVPQGIITEIVKDQNAPTGHVSLFAGGRTLKFRVTEATQFETVRGDEVRATNFLEEHRGERAAIAGIANSNPLTAAK